MNYQRLGNTIDVLTNDMTVQVPVLTTRWRPLQLPPYCDVWEGSDSLSDLVSTLSIFMAYHIIHVLVSGSKIKRKIRARQSENRWKVYLKKNKKVICSFNLNKIFLYIGQVRLLSKWNGGEISCYSKLIAEYFRALASCWGEMGWIFRDDWSTHSLEKIEGKSCR